MTFRLRHLLTTSLFVAAVPAFAHAQATVKDSVKVEEVIVTAQRRSENIQNVPIAVSSFTASNLTTQHVLSTEDIGRIVPNMFASNNVGQASANVYYIRGLGQTQSFPTFEPQVSTYVDDIYIGRQNANNVALFGVQQIQVLRGPQGTLFGRNSTGGAILVTLQKPAAEFGGEVELGYGSFDRFTGRASVDIPVGDQIRTRTSIFDISDDGYVHDLTTGQKLNGTHDWGVREALIFTPSKLANVEWSLSADYSDSHAADVLNQPNTTGDGGTRISYSGYGTGGGALKPFLHGSLGGQGQGVEVKTGGVASNIKIDLPAGTLNLITGFRGLRQELGVDFPDAQFGPMVPYDQGAVGSFALAQGLSSYQYSQEVKFSADLGDKLKYTVGAFYLYETNLNHFGAAGNLGAFFGVNYFPFPFGEAYEQNDTVSEAVYAQGDYKVTSALTVTLGGRFTHEIKNLSVTAPASGGFDSANIRAAGHLTRLEADEFTPHLSVQYRFNPDVMAYASATRGFQGGGWNGLAFSATDYNDFKPETLWSYELGMRSETPDHKLRLNGTLFYENINDYQLLSDNPVDHMFVTNNAASYEAFGAEFDVNWRPIKHLSLVANLGLMDAHYYAPSALVRSQQASCAAAPGGASCNSGIVNNNGHLATPQYIPPVTFSGSASYDFVYDVVTVTPSIGVQWTARQEVDTAGEPVGVDKARTLLDAGLNVQPTNKPWSISAECRNCTMVNYATAYLFGYRYYNDPGRWDVKFKYKF